MPATLPMHDVDQALNLAQQAMYRFAALTLLDPRAGAWDELDSLQDSTLLEDSFQIVRQNAADDPGPPGPGELPLSELSPAAVMAQMPATAEALNQQFEAAFGLLVSGVCPPYETEYLNGKFAVQRAQTLADISGFYRAFGLQPSSGHRERHDHIVLELEFMALLLGLELQAADLNASVRSERIAVCQEARSKFFREHLGWWAPAFAHLLAREATGGFYGEAARLLAALLASQRRHLGLPILTEHPQPSSLERPEECEGCSLGAS